MGLYQGNIVAGHILGREGKGTIFSKKKKMVKKKKNNRKKSKMLKMCTKTRDIFYLFKKGHSCLRHACDMKMLAICIIDVVLVS